MKYIKTLLLVLTLILIISIPLKTADIIHKSDQDNIVDGKLEINEPKEDIKVEQSKEETVTKPTTTDTPTNTTVGWWTYPEDIKTTTRSGNDLLVLVNKEYKLPSTYAPTDLVKASVSGIRRGDSYYLRNILMSDMKEMITASKADGIDLSIVSGYRSYSTQKSTYQYWLDKNNGNVAYVDTFSARAGHSQHQLGTTLDFSTNVINDALGDSFANTKASKWLIENSYKYGFVLSFPKGYESTTGYKYESWHYRYIGKSNASEMHTSGLILEKYLQTEN